MSLYAKEVDNNTKEKLKETYNNWEDDDYDFKTTKELLINYICKNCRTVNDHNLSSEPDEYILKLTGSEGLYLTKKTNNLTGYLFNINDGSVYIIEYDTEHDIHMNPSTPFVITLMMLSNGFHNVQPEFYLE